MTPTSARPVYRIVASAVAMLAALAIAGCSGAPSTDTSVHPAGVSTPMLLDAAGANAAGLSAVAQLGVAHGNSPDVVVLGGRLATAGQTLVDVVQRAGETAGVRIDTAAPAVFRSSLTELFSRIGPDFDPAWLKAVNDQAVAARAAVNALLAAPDISDSTRAALRSWLTDMAATAAAAAATAGPAGATAPTSVAAGDGGRLAAVSNPWPLLSGIGLIGLGALLVGAALYRRRAAV